LKIKQSLGIPDPRIGLKECELCDNEGWRPGVTCAVSGNSADAGSSHSSVGDETEALVQAITNQIMNGSK